MTKKKPGLFNPQRMSNKQMQVILNTEENAFLFLMNHNSIQTLKQLPYNFFIKCICLLSLH